MNFPSKQVMTRYVVVAIVLGLLAVWILGKATYIIVKERDFWMEVRRLNYNKQNHELPATRGNILAANGELLAGTLPQYRMYMDFMSWEKDKEDSIKDQHRRDSLLNAKMDSICYGMAKIFPDVEPAKLRAHLQKGRDKKSHYWPIYPRRVTYLQYLETKKLPLFNLPRYKSGFNATKYELRKKPYGRLANRTIGDLYAEDNKARSGLELSFDSVLRGKPGRYHWKKVRNRNVKQIDEPAVAGLDIQTTLDIGMQDVCEKALADRMRELGATYSGVCILMEVATGDIKAITSLSQTSNGDFIEQSTAAVSNLYEPGSVFKPMSFMVAMNDGHLSMTDGVNVGCGVVELHGRNMKDHNWRKGGYNQFLDVSGILQRSSNVGVSVLIDRFYKDNPQQFVDGLHRLGIADDLQVPIPGYTKARIKDPKSTTAYWAKTDLPWMSIGYVTQLPPIATVSFYNGVANGGKMMRPRLVKAVLRNGEVVREYPVSVVREQMCKPEVAKNIQQCLFDVVNAKTGTGKAAGSRMFHVAGKTGTAQIWTKAGQTSRYLVSFAGYFPAEKPIYSCIVCLERSGMISGGGDCGPVFKRVAETVMALHTSNDFNQARDTVNVHTPLTRPGNLTATAQVLASLGIHHENPFGHDGKEITWGSAETTPTSLVLKAESYKIGTVPDVSGYGLRDALFRLEKLGLRVKVKGVGRVSAQSLAPGHRFTKGEVIELTLKKAKMQPLALPAAPKPAQVALPDTAQSDTANTPAPPKNVPGNGNSSNSNEQTAGSMAWALLPEQKNRVRTI